MPRRTTIIDMTEMRPPLFRNYLERMKFAHLSLNVLLAIAAMSLFGGCSRTSEGPAKPIAVPQKANDSAGGESRGARIHERSVVGGSPKSLIVVGGTNDTVACGIQRLLAEHHVGSTIVSASKATRPKAAGFDLVIVVGEGRSASRLPDFDRPVLGFGCYGCSYFGSLQLKHGKPWT